MRSLCENMKRPLPLPFHLEVYHIQTWIGKRRKRDMYGHLETSATHVMLHHCILQRNIILFA